MKLAVVLPVYNEKPNLERLLIRIANFLRSIEYDFHILIVDDGSSDGSLAIAEHCSQFLPITIIKHDTNLGLGRAILTGLTAGAEVADYVVTMDADDSHDPSLIPDMICGLDSGADVVIASRFQKNSKVVGLSVYRRLLTCVSSKTLSIVFPFANVRDYSSGYRAYKSSILKQLQSKYGQTFVKESGFACMLEILLKLRSSNVKVSEVPMVLHYERKLGRSKMRVLNTVARYAAVVYHTANVSG